MIFIYMYVCVCVYVYVYVNSPLVCEARKDQYMRVKKMYKEAIYLVKKKCGQYAYIYTSVYDLRINSNVCVCVRLCVNLSPVCVFGCV